MKKSDFHYDLPPELIAQAPLSERSASRLLLVPPAPEAFADRHVRDLPGLLQPGDLLVFNDTRVIPARLFGQKATGGRVEILIERLLSAHEARAQVGASKSPRPGSRIALDAGGEAEVLGLTVTPVSDENREALGLAPGAEGLAVTKVDVASEAYGKGLREGDVIAEAGQQKVVQVSDLQDRIDEAREAGRKSILLLVRRAGDPRFVALAIDE